MAFQLSSFKSLKMMLWKCCTEYASKFGKLSSGHRTGKGQFSFQCQRKAMPKNAQTTTQLHSSMATHSSTLAWKTPWMEEPGRLQSMGSLRVGHNWATSVSLFTFMHWRRKWQPTPVFLPGESQGWGSLWAAIYGVTQSRTRLKWLSSRVLYVTLCQRRRYWHGFVASVWWQF